MDLEQKELLVRIDERTKGMDAKSDVLLARFDDHEKKDREDFREVYSRLNTLEKRQNWLFGVGSGIAFLFGIAAAWIKTTFNL